MVNADTIPDFLTVDLAKAAIGDSIHISSVTLPANVKPVISDRDFTLATIVHTVNIVEEKEADKAEAGAEEKAKDE